MSIDLLVPNKLKMFQKSPDGTGYMYFNSTDGIELKHDNQTRLLYLPDNDYVTGDYVSPDTKFIFTVIEGEVVSIKLDTGEEIHSYSFCDESPLWNHPHIAFYVKENTDAIN